MRKNKLLFQKRFHEQNIFKKKKENQKNINVNVLARLDFVWIIFTKTNVEFDIIKKKKKKNTVSIKVIQSSHYYENFKKKNEKKINEILILVICIYVSSL